MAVSEKILYDDDDRVRMKAPEIFRILGKRRPPLVRPFVTQLQQMAENDNNRVVRTHCLGAIKATLPTRAEQPQCCSGQPRPQQEHTERRGVVRGSSRQRRFGGAETTSEHPG